MLHIQLQFQGITVIFPLEFIRVFVMRVILSDCILGQFKKVLKTQFGFVISNKLRNSPGSVQTSSPQQI